MFFLIVGLGNPGKTYRHTRHNLGFRVVDRVAEIQGIGIGQKKFRGEFGSGSIGDKRVGLLKPSTYMNLSGEAVAAAVSYLKIPTEQVLIVHDDVDLALSLNADGFARIRLGVGRPAEAGQDVAGHVLQPFSAGELSSAAEAVERAAGAAITWLEDGLTTAMNRYNSWAGQEG
jgi:PTH1 family peptidyl-tRNA hydrolase